MNHWFERDMPRSKNRMELTAANNQKYGEYDYGKDSRSLDKTFRETFEASLGDDEFENVIICGANSGYEVGIARSLEPKAKITAVDISDMALSKSSYRFPAVAYLHGDMEDLTTFSPKQFDLYICLRAIHSTNIGVENALKEAVRVTKKRIVISISNGYVLDGKLVHGMYEYDTREMNPEKPYRIRDVICESLNAKGWDTSTSESDAEVFVVAMPSSSVVEVERTATS